MSRLSVGGLLVYTGVVSSLVEIENAVSRLSREEFAIFVRWFEEERNNKWDKEIETDSTAGAFDQLLGEVAESVDRREARPTDELCDNPKIQRSL
jgi:hypothetical protein